jgi:hypothetical protein
MELYLFKYLMPFLKPITLAIIGRLGIKEKTVFFLNYP